MSKFTEYEELMLEMQIQQTLLLSTTMMIAAKASENQHLIDSCHEISKDSISKLVKVANAIE